MSVNVEHTVLLTVLSGVVCSTSRQSSLSLGVLPVIPCWHFPALNTEDSSEAQILLLLLEISWTGALEFNKARAIWRVSAWHISSVLAKQVLQKDNGVMRRSNESRLSPICDAVTRSTLISIVMPLRLQGTADKWHLWCVRHHHSACTDTCRMTSCFFALIGCAEPSQTPALIIVSWEWKRYSCRYEVPLCPSSESQGPVHQRHGLQKEVLVLTSISFMAGLDFAIRAFIPTA